MKGFEYLPVRRLDFERAIECDAEFARLQRLRDDISVLVDESRCREAIDRLASDMPIATLQRGDEERYRIHASYELALLYLSTFQWAEGRRLIEAAGLPAPGDLPDLPFDSFSLAAIYLREIQSRRADGHAPSIAIVAMPKSASAHLSTSIGELLDVPTLRMSILDCVMPRWVRQICSGACTTHEHYPGRADNIQALIEGGCSRLFVQLRDPRSASYSYLFHRSRETQLPDRNAPQLDRLAALTKEMTKWAAGWIEMSRRIRDTGVIEMIPIRFREFVADPAAMIFRILDMAGANVDRETVDQYFAARASQKRPPENFREGDDDAWRKVASSSLRDELWEAIPDIVRNELNLER